jgi:hypothetical protein
MDTTEDSSVQTLSAKEVASSLWSRNASEKCRLGITDSVSSVPHCNTLHWPGPKHDRCVSRSCLACL